jgi:hypothetical protein
VEVLSPGSFFSSLLFFLSSIVVSKTSTFVDNCTRFGTNVREVTEGLDAARESLVAGFRTVVVAFDCKTRGVVGGRGGN